MTERDTVRAMGASPVPSPVLVFTVLFVGLAAVSTAATFVRLAHAQGMPSLVLAAGRLAIAAAVLAPIVLLRHLPQLRRLRARDWRLLVVAGVILGAHFAAWISALEYTSVIATVVLGSTTPIFVALLAAPILRERISSLLLAGILLTVAGGILVGWSGDAGGATTRPAPLLGNGLALLAAVAFAAYIMLGRRLRRELPVVPYVCVVYGIAALALALACLATGAPIVGHTPAGYGWLVAVGLVPQLLGHSSFNYALGYLPASYVGLVSRLEPVGSTVLAGLVLAEWPDLLALIGAAVIIAGVALPSGEIEVDRGVAGEEGQST